MGLNKIQQQIFVLIQQFLERQALVLEVLEDLRPDIVLQSRSHNKKSTREYLLEIQKLRRQYSKIPNPGFWGENQEWEYYIHGLGCRLKHVITAEVIEWDLPDLNIFDSFWFIAYIEWLFKSNIEDDNIQMVKEFQIKNNLTLQEIIFPVLEQLENQNIISRVINGSNPPCKYIFNL
jgi:hypothetical protein